MSRKKKYELTEIEETLGIQRTFIVQCIQYEWIKPIQLENQAFQQQPHLAPLPPLDDEDLARLRLIHELITDFGVNQEAVPIILHLIDQLYTVLDLTKKAA